MTSPHVSIPSDGVALASGLTRKRKSRVKWWVLGAMLLVVVLAVAAAVVRHRRHQVTVVTVGKATIRNITQLVSATGKIQPEVEVKITPEVTGEIIALPFREGDRVKKGDLLVRIKPDIYKFQVEQAEAELAATRAAALEAQAQLERAREDFKRNEDLYRKKLISDSDYITSKTQKDEAQANYESSMANIQRAEGSLNQARDQLAKTAIYSPIDGTISQRTSEVGERVAGTGSYGMAEIMRVADLSNMEVQVDINENDIVNVKVGDKAGITIDAFPGREFTGVVKEIGTTAQTTNQNTQEEATNFAVNIRILDKNVPFRPGMSANADVETQTAHEVVAVPIQAVTVRSRIGNQTIDQLARRREQQAAQNHGAGAAAAVNQKQQQQREREDRQGLQRVVFVVHDGKVRQVPIETGIADNTYMEIKQGLKAGDEVVTGSFSVVTRVLKDGMVVQVANPHQPPK